MNSCIYECKVMHYRNYNIERRFSYKYFMFYLDIDEINFITKKLFFLSRNKFNIFSFRDSDHFINDPSDVKQNIINYLKENSVDTTNIRIMLLTNVAIWGYNFNPVSFYFCFLDDKPLCVVPEVGNTFKEQKFFFLGRDKFTGSKFYSTEIKNFYVSPFIQHNTIFEFNLYTPDKDLKISINDYIDGKKIFNATLTGKQQILNDFKLFKFSLKYPLVTLKIIGAIHFQALILLLKKIRYYKKGEFPELQKGMVKKWKR